MVKLKREIFNTLKLHQLTSKYIPMNYIRNVFFTKKLPKKKFIKGDKYKDCHSKRRVASLSPIIKLS